MKSKVNQQLSVNWHYGSTTSPTNLHKLKLIPVIFSIFP